MEDRQTNNPRILMVDDSLETLDILKTSLERHEYSAFTARNCKEAEDLLTSNVYDLIILDLTLPDGDGIDFCATLRNRGLKTPIIMLTARDNISDKVIGLDCGADDYIVKPFEIIELFARIKACLRRYTGAIPNNFVFGNVEINIRKRQVKVKGLEVIFTPKEFDLLIFFVSQKGIPISRDEIRQQIWKDAALYSWSRTIDVHVQHIRQKIEEDPSDPKYILTISGIGYMFNHDSQG